MLVLKKYNKIGFISFPIFLISLVTCQFLEGLLGFSIFNITIVSLSYFIWWILENININNENKFLRKQYRKKNKISINKEEKEEFEKWFE